MKPFAWVNYAFQALATEGYGHSGSDAKARNGRGDYSSRTGIQQSLFIGRDGKYRYVEEFDSDFHTQASPPRSLKLRPVMINLRSEYYQMSETFEPESPPSITSPGFDASFDNDLKNARSEFDISILSLHGSYEDSEIPSTSGSEDHVQLPSPTNRKPEISAMIFDSSATLPISIIVTSPDEDAPELLQTRPTIQRKSVSAPLLNTNSGPQNDFNTTLLMPPTDNLLDSRKSRKAQEFQEVRKWLIIFINSKGDKFPRHLRLRMMKAYSIHDSDLAPEIIAKFHAEVQDEGVALEEGEEDEAASMRILGAAFRSKIEEALPKREPVVPFSLSPPPSWQTNSSTRLKTGKAEFIKIKKESRPATPIKDEDLDIDLVPSWLGPMISTSTASRDSLLSDQQYLKRAYSAPNLKPSRPHLTSPSSTKSIPGLRARGRSINGVETKMKKRPNFISEGFGAIRDALGGKSKDRELKRKLATGP